MSNLNDSIDILEKDIFPAKRETQVWKIIYFKRKYLNVVRELSNCNMVKLLVCNICSLYFEWVIVK